MPFVPLMLFVADQVGTCAAQASEEGRIAGGHARLCDLVHHGRPSSGLFRRVEQGLERGPHLGIGVLQKVGGGQSDERRQWAQLGEAGQAVDDAGHEPPLDEVGGVIDERAVLVRLHVLGLDELVRRCVVGQAPSRPHVQPVVDPLERLSREDVDRAGTGVALDLVLELQPGPLHLAVVVHGGLEIDARISGGQEARGEHDRHAIGLLERDRLDEPGDPLAIGLLRLRALESHPWG